MADLKDAPLAKLSLEDIAASLIMLVPGCLTLGHQSITSTLGYAHNAPGSAAAFVKDLFTLGPEEVARKWYGGEDPAKEMFARATAMALFGDDAAGPAA